jgi:hypothetical protein
VKSLFDQGRPDVTESVTELMADAEDLHTCDNLVPLLETASECDLGLAPVPIGKVLWISMLLPSVGFWWSSLRPSQGYSQVLCPECFITRGDSSCNHLYRQVIYLGSHLSSPLLVASS